MSTQALGRPSGYSPIATAICELIIEGKSLRQICDLDGMPAKSSILKWLGQQKDFADQYARARELCMEAMSEEILSIADDSKHDTLFDDEGNPYENKEWLNRSRLRVDTRKWLMSKLAPKKYADKPADINVNAQLGIQLVHAIPRPSVRSAEPPMIEADVTPADSDG